MSTITDFVLVYAVNRERTKAFNLGDSTVGKAVPFHNKGNTYGTLEFPAHSVTFSLPDGEVPPQDMSTKTIRSELLDPVAIVDGTNEQSFRMDGEWRFGQATVNEIAATSTIRISRVPFRPNLIRGDVSRKKITNLFSFRVNDVPANEDGDAEQRLLFGSPFDTAKPEGLLHRIIEVASATEDVVLDCFAGSGTTAAVAHKMGRRWITVEASADVVETFTRPRLEKVVASDDLGGITEAVSWEGGGGFRLLEVGPSMFAEIEGRVWLADWAKENGLWEATAAQLGYDYEPDGPFAGRKGRTRLAVVDGLVNEDVVRVLVSALEPEERLVLCGTAVDPTAAEALRGLRPGSRVRKIPASILAEYRIASEWRTAAEQAPSEEPESLAPAPA